jgi:hypothetical protein
VKLGDSLGRSRRRRKKPGASEAEPAGDAAPQGEQGEQGADSKPSTADGDDIFAPRTSLGSETKESRGWGALGKLRVRDLALVAVGLALLGWVVGYGIATRIVFEKDLGAERITTEAAMAKAFATEAAQRIIDDAVQILGGRGVMADHPVDLLYRSIRALRIYEGTTEIQHLIIAGMLVAEAKAEEEPSPRGAGSDGGASR